jgi:hypothetical protein
MTFWMVPNTLLRAAAVTGCRRLIPRRYDRGVRGGPPLVFAAVSERGLLGSAEPSPKRRKDGP